MCPYKTDTFFYLSQKLLSQVVDAMMTITEHNDLEDGTRVLATEFLVTLTEARDRASGMMVSISQSPRSASAIAHTRLTLSFF